jgi:transposase
LVDRCAIHKEAEIRPLIEAVGARRVYLPPSSPDFSPIENFWSKVKGMLKSLGARTDPALEVAIQEAFSQVTKLDIRNWFAHCCCCSS